MAANFTSYTIKALNKIPTALSRSEKDLLFFRNVPELLDTTHCTLENL